MKHLVAMIAAAGLMLALPVPASSQEGDAASNGEKAAKKKPKPRKTQSPPALGSAPAVGSAPPTRGGNMTPRTGGTPTVPNRRP